MKTYNLWIETEVLVEDEPGIFDEEIRDPEPFKVARYDNKRDMEHAKSVLSRLSRYPIDVLEYLLAALEVSAEKG